MEKDTPSTAVIIVAAGRGTRAGGPVAKQWQSLAGRRVADWTVGLFCDHPAIDQVVVVHHKDDADHVASLPANVLRVVGGATRSASVLAGLRALKENPPKSVLIHDVARPCLDPVTIDTCLEQLQSTNAVAVGIPVTDALWVAQDGHVDGTQDRSHLWRAQTPQGFDYDLIMNAHASGHDAADDVEVARLAGHAVKIIEDSANNIKITRAEDFARAERILAKQMDIRVGNGFDVHKFGPGDQVTLCGVSVPHSHGLVGHSDADVAMHTVTDAIYGALADGDIGQHFPPSDPQWKGADSAVFLTHAVELATSRGFRINHVDCTIICEMPKIGPHAAAMKTRMADLMGMDADRISVKATTSEKLGFTGRGEGIAAMATATLVSS